MLETREYRKEITKAIKDFLKREFGQEDISFDSKGRIYLAHTQFEQCDNVNNYDLSNFDNEFDVQVLLNIESHSLVIKYNDVIMNEIQYTKEDLVYFMKHTDFNELIYL